MQTNSSTREPVELVGVIALVAPFLATIGLLFATGALESSQRDQPVWLALVIALALLGGALLAIGAFLGRGVRFARWLATVGAIAAVLGFGITVALAASNASPESRPLISASFDERTETVTGVVSVANLPADGRLAVQVDLQTIAEEQGIDEPSPFSPTGSLPIERASVGPDADGNASHEFTLPVLINGLYTHIVIEATPGDGERRCIELDSPASPDEQTACAFIPIG